MEANFQYRSRTTSLPRHDYYYSSCGRSKTIESPTSQYSVSRLRYPVRHEIAYCCESATSKPPQWKRAPSTQSWVKENTFRPVHQQTIEEWVDEQIHLTDRSNYERRPQPLGKEALRQRMWDELLYEYETEAHKWMKHEAEMRRRTQEIEREEARRKIVQEDIMRIEARVRQRRDSERQTIAEERRRSMETAKETAWREQARVERAVLEAWKSYESRWAAIFASTDPLAFRDIPWPLVTPPVSVVDITTQAINNFLLHPVHSREQSRRDRIRTALLRWHPDRFRRILQKVVESDQSIVEEGVGIIARYLNELLTKETKVVRQSR